MYENFIDFTHFINDSYESLWQSGSNTILFYYGCLLGDWWGQSNFYFKNKNEVFKKNHHFIGYSLYLWVAFLLTSLIGEWSTGLIV